MNHLDSGSLSVMAVQAPLHHGNHLLFFTIDLSCTGLPFNFPLAQVYSGCILKLYVYQWGKKGETIEFLSGTVTYTLASNYS